MGIAIVALLFLFIVRLAFSLGLWLDSQTHIRAWPHWKHHEATFPNCIFINVLKMLEAALIIFPQGLHFKNRGFLLKKLREILKRPGPNTY